MSSTDKAITPQTAAEWARLINEGPFDTTDGDREWQCRGCKDPISVDHDCEPTALCGMCSVEAAIVLAAERDGFREAWSATLGVDLLRQLFTKPHALGEEGRGPWIRLHAGAYELAPRLLAALDKVTQSEDVARLVVDAQRAIGWIDYAASVARDGERWNEAAGLGSARTAVMELVATLDVTATQAQLREKAVEFVIEGTRVQLSALQERLNVANARAEEAGRGLVELLAKVDADAEQERAERESIKRAMEALRERLASWRLVFEQGAEAYSRGVRFLDCPYQDERSAPWLRGWESARDVATIEAVERERDAASARAEETRRGLEELLAKVEADGAQEQAERAAIREAFEGLRARLDVAEARPSVETCKAERAAGNGGCGACALCCREAIERAETAEAGLAEVRRVVEEHDGEDPIPMVLPTIADEVRARLAAADRKAREAERERDAANAKT